MTPVRCRVTLKIADDVNALSASVGLPSYRNLRSFEQLPDGTFGCTVDVDDDECTDGRPDSAKIRGKYGRDYDITGVVL